MGPQLVVKSLALIWRNFGPALGATVMPLGLCLLAAGILAYVVAGDAVIEGMRLAPEERVEAAIGSQGPGRELAALGLGAILAAFGFLWAAVAWHRFVLLEESPGLLPALHAGRIGAYLWAWVRLIGPLILVGLAVATAGAAIAVVAAAAGVPALAFLLFFGLNILAIYATLRFSLVLPAAAVGKRMGVVESWELTGGAREAILIAAALLSVLNAVIELAGGALGLAGGAGAVLSLGTWWFGFVLGLSILTAIYGHVVEGRPLS